MKELEWDKSKSIDVPEIDEEPQSLFRVINKLIKIQDEDNKDPKQAFEQGIKYFRQHSEKLCVDEEACMEAAGYLGREQHARVHKSFRENTLPALEREVRESFSRDAMDHFLGVCAGWLIGHALTEDMPMAVKGDNRFDMVMEDCELDFMKSVVAELVFDLFHLQSNLISDMYGGEKFGRGVYYRLCYTNGEDRHEILLAWEEQLLLYMAGISMGVDAKHLNRFMIHAARCAAQQLVSRVMEQIPHLHNFTLKEESLLNYEQYERIFERRKMQASLLYDTGEGYLSYCIIAPSASEETEAYEISREPVENENTVRAVEIYLKEYERAALEAQDKPKILVVDDSMTWRHFLQRLLGDKYNVSLAASGAGAIRAIVLNRPDLILLDYEMPVCDGPQVLEMMRSDEAFQDLPVVFVTCRNDPHSVRRIMSLRPHGYLPKDLAPDVMLKKIDGFFCPNDPLAVLATS